MFRPLLADRKALLAIAGLAICGAYVAGALSAVGGLETTSALYAARYPPAGWIAHSGASPFESSMPSPPPGVARVALTTFDDGNGTIVVAAVVEESTKVHRVVGTGTALARGRDGPARVLGTVLPVVELPAGLPGDWAWVDASDLARLDPTPSTIWILGDGSDVPLPPGAKLVESSGLPAFALSGLADLQAALGFLVAGTALVVLFLASNVAYLAVVSSGRDLRLLYALGGSRSALVRLSTGWMARVVGVGLASGAALGVALVSGAFAIAPVLGIDALGAPRVDGLRFLGSMAILAASALVGAWLGARAAVRRIFGDTRRAGTRGAVLAVAGCLTVFATVHLVLASVVEPPLLYPPDAIVVSTSESPIPMRSVVPAGLAASLKEEGDAERAAPVIFAFTTLGGSPVAVRGGPAGELLALHGAKIVEGRMPERSDEILVGSRLAARIGLGVGDATWLAGSFQPAAEPVLVVGVFESQTLLVDEVVAHLDVVRSISDTPAGMAQAIEARGADRDRLFARVAEIRQPRLALASVVGPAGAVEVRVFDQDGNAVANARVTSGSQEARTNSTGTAVLALAAGDHVLVAAREGFLSDTATAKAIAATAAPNLVATGLQFAAPPRPGREAVLHLAVRNFGADGGSANFTIEDGRASATTEIVLDGGRSTTALLVLRAPSSGLWTVRSGGHAIAIDVDLAGLATQWKLAQAAGVTARSESTAETAEAFIGNVIVTTGALSLLTILLVSVGVASVCARKVWERGEDLSLLRSVGATRAQLQGLVLLRTLRPGALASIAGLAVGAGLATGLFAVRPLVLFGHELPLKLEPVAFVGGFVLALGGLAASALVAAALWIRSDPAGPARPVAPELGEMLA